MAQTCELSFGLDFKDNKMTFDEILDLPQAISRDSGKKMVVCIDEFQNINEYDDPLAFQRNLRSHWQKHTDVCYCLYGSKRHMLLDIFHNYNMPFYKFGDILFLEKIPKEDWIEFIGRKFSETGKKISEHNEEERQKTSPYNFAYFVLNRDREELYRRIDLRVDLMMQNGLLDEVRKLKRMGYTRNMVSMQGLGYKELLDYLDGDITEEEAIYRIKRDTRHFAKRQLTWFRREQDVIWIQKENFTDDSEILDFIQKILMEKEISM